MKKYVVLQQIDNFEPRVMELFDELNDAVMYQSAMRKAHPDRKYEIYCNEVYV